MGNLILNELYIYMNVHKFILCLYVSILEDKKKAIIQTDFHFMKYRK